MTVPSVPEVLRKAADAIDHFGHNTNGTYVNSSGCLCAIGAIRLAIGIEPNSGLVKVPDGEGTLKHSPTHRTATHEEYVAEQRARDAVENEIRNGPRDGWKFPAAQLGSLHIPYWNDAVAGSKEVVTATLRRAAERVERS